MHVLLVAHSLGERQLFQSIVCQYAEPICLEMFPDSDQALAWAEKHTVDIVFVDTDLPGVSAVDVANAFLAISPNSRVVLAASDGEYALDAWRIGASGYLLKPFTEEKINRELQKCQYRPLPSQRVIIHTIPSFSVTVNGSPLHMTAAKPRELFALLVNCGERGLTSAEGIAYLWPDKDNDKNTQALFRMTYKRLVSILEQAGIADIISSRESKRFLLVDKVDCDLYHLLAGDSGTQKKYAGEYLQEYSWAEERNAQLYHMLMS